jgi:serine/threonine-protein kinase
MSGLLDTPKEDGCGSPRTPPPHDPIPPPGDTRQRLGRYELLEEIARGGMGAVWRARDPELNRDLAIKVMRPEVRHNPDLVRRFLEEAQITAQLPHPGIVPVHDIGKDEDGLPFLVMKLVRGRTLEQLLAERDSPRNDLARFVDVFEQVCQAVAFAHEHRVLHRDLKPGNVMVGRFGEVQVMDWGLAKVKILAETKPDDSRTEPGSEVQTRRSREGAALTEGALGTWAYMPPEQANGEVEWVDERSDVFALGGILCAILTGHPPYIGDGHKVKRKSQCGDTAEALARLDGCGADVELVALAKACLSAEWVERPADAGAVARRVAAYRQGTEERLRAAERERVAAQARVVERLQAVEERAVEERKRRRLAVALSATVLLALLGTVVGVSLFALHERKRLGQISKANEILVSVFRHLDPDTDEKEGLPLRAQLERQLDEAAESLEGAAVGDPLAVARLQNILGETQQKLG